MPTSYTEKNGPFEVILSEANGHQSRDVITLLTGTAYKAGQVLGKITSGGKYQMCDSSAVDGSQTAAAVLLKDVDATGGDAPGLVLVRNAEVKGALLVYKSGQSGPNQAAQRVSLAALGIITR